VSPSGFKINLMTLINCLNKVLGYITINRFSNVLEITTDKNVFIIKYDRCYLLIYKGVKLYTKQELIKHLFKDIIYKIKIYKNSSVLICYCYEKRCAHIIQREYRKYRIRTARIRNDLVIRGLTEYFFHPSRLTFKI